MPMPLPPSVFDSAPRDNTSGEPVQPVLGADAAAVLRQFRVLFSAVRSHFQLIEKRTGLGGAQMWALSVLQRQPGIGVGELARAMDIHQSTASNLVRALTAKGLLTSTRAGEDRRLVQLTITPAALSLLSLAKGPVQGVLPEALGRMDADSLSRLHGDLGRLILLVGAGADSAAANKPLADM